MFENFPRRISLAVCCVIVLFFCQPLAVQAQTVRRPNIILLNLDDADAELLTQKNLDEHFPALAELSRRATVFTNAHCTTPFCAPSRAALMTGKYGFNNGCKTGSETVASSVGFPGGYQRFRTLGHDRNELGVWMKAAGYHTIHVGKYHHNGFDFVTPPGWDDFSINLGTKYFGATRFSNVNRTPAANYRLKSNQYITAEERREAMIAMTKQVRQAPNTPFFLYLAPLAPHAPAGPDLSLMAEPRYRNYAAGLKQPTDTPDYDEADISDKPVFLQREPLRESEKQHLQNAFIYRLRSMKSVDDTVAAIVGRLKQTGQWQNTYFLLTSDNGYSLGHHRLKFKKDPYQRSTNVPLLAVSPRRQTARNASHLIAHIDICPTILDLAGATIPDDIDGKSFADLIDNPQLKNPVTWQRSILVENWAEKAVLGEFIPMSYTAERFYDRMHIAWSNGEHEFYRFQSDPYQLENIYDQLNQNQQTALNISILRFRKRDADPTITLTSPVSGTAIDSAVSFSGYMDDNSAPVMARLVIQSMATDRYYNGQSWQDESTYIPINPSSVTSSINFWDHDLKIFSETQNHFDVLVSHVTPVDDSGNKGQPKTTFNYILDASIYAAINPSVDRKVYRNTRLRIEGHHGNQEGQRVVFSVFDLQTRKFFNGQSMQDGFAQLTAANLPNHRWSSRLKLPRGEYRFYAQATAGRLYQQTPSTADFSVEF